MPSPRGDAFTTDIAIVGGGLSGSLVAIHLLRRLPRGVRVMLLERAPRLGRGVAYSTPFASHLLNVPAQNMSALPGDPSHFLRWWERRDPSARGDAFAPRRIYGEYLGELLHQAAASADSATWRTVQDHVVSAEPQHGEMVLRTERGALIGARHVVLALGNLPPSNPPLHNRTFAEHPAYCRDPWAPEALAGIQAEAPILLVGTGLTMVDVALALREQGHRGPMLALSRHGLLPQVHAASTARQLTPPDEPSIRGLLRWLRRETRTDWRGAIDAVRPSTARLWMALPMAERRRFLRHLRPYWDVHRHRMAPAVGEAIAALQRSGKLRVGAGRLVSIESAGDWLDVRYRLRGTPAVRSVAVAHVINCTGPASDITRTGEPLLDSLLRQGQIRPDPLRLGIDTTDDGRVIDASGQASDALVVVGPLRRARTWEATAVPELRVQAEETAALLEATLTHELRMEPHSFG